MPGVQFINVSDLPAISQNKPEFPEFLSTKVVPACKQLAMNAAHILIL